MMGLVPLQEDKQAPDLSLFPCTHTEERPSEDRNRKYLSQKEGPRSSPLVVSGFGVLAILIGVQ